MEARIVGFRGSDRHPDNRHCIIETSEKHPASLIGKRVSWRTPSGMPISGKIISTHARDKLIARFTRGLPGFALGTAVSFGKVGITKRFKEKPRVLVIKPVAPAIEEKIKEEVAEKARVAKKKEKVEEKVGAVKEVEKPAKKAKAPKKKPAEKKEKAAKKSPAKPKAKKSSSKS